MANNESGIGAGGVMMAFVAGMLTGAALALLFAPATGEETRDFLNQRAREGRDRASEAARQGREHLASAFERGREAYQSARGPAAAGKEQES